MVYFSISPLPGQYQKLQFKFRDQLEASHHVPMFRHRNIYFCFDLQRTQCLPGTRYANIHRPSKNENDQWLSNMSLPGGPDKTEWLEPWSPGVSASGGLGWDSRTHIPSKPPGVVEGLTSHILGAFGPRSLALLSSGIWAGTGRDPYCFLELILKSGSFPS